MTTSRALLLILILCNTIVGTVPVTPDITLVPYLDGESAFLSHPYVIYELHSSLVMFEPPSRLFEHRLCMRTSRRLGWFQSSLLVFGLNLKVRDDTIAGMVVCVEVMPASPRRHYQYRLR
jgi:hypothetical protein